MSTFTEDTITVEIAVKRDLPAGTDHVYVTASSLNTATGQVIRTLHRLEITDQMSAARMTGIGALLDDVIARIKAGWNIA